MTEPLLLSTVLNQSLEGQKIYEWDQGIDEVNIYIQPPPGTEILTLSGVRARDLQVVFESHNLLVGIEGNPPFLHVLALSLQEPLFSGIVKSESFWTLEDGELHLSMKVSNRN